jgi:hypothetical protein
VVPAAPDVPDDPELPELPDAPELPELPELPDAPPVPVLPPWLPAHAVKNATPASTTVSSLFIKRSPRIVRRSFAWFDVARNEKSSREMRYPAARPASSSRPIRVLP